MSLTGRPSSPPFLLTVSSQILAPSNACLPLAASGPVSAMAKPILIGSPDCAAALFAKTPAATMASRVAPMRLSIKVPPRRLFVDFILANSHGCARAYLVAVLRPVLDRARPFDETARQKLMGHGPPSLADPRSATREDKVTRVSR